MPSSSFFLRSSTTFVSALSLLSSTVVAAPSQLKARQTTGQSWNVAYDFFVPPSGKTSFFDNFNFFSSADPTHGFVYYTTQSQAQQAGLYNSNPLVSGGANGQAARMDVDYTNTYDGSQPYYNVHQTGVGRPSVRIESSYNMNAGQLIIADIGHMPASTCGSWPAFWALGADPWPNNGEVDIIEGWNQQTSDFVSAHTNSQCTVQQSSAFTGTVDATNCNTMFPNPGTSYSGNDINYTGCKISDDTGSPSFGTNFNNVGGGVYAMKWTSSSINVYFWQRSQIPADVLSGNPQPDTWKKPLAIIGGSQCDINKNFNNMRIIFDTTFCGDAADNAGTWGASGGCGSQTKSTCSNYVGNNPSAYQQSYWSVNSMKVYKYGNKPVTTTSSSTTTTTKSTTTSTSTTTTTTTTKATTTTTTTTKSSTTSSAPTSSSTSKASSTTSSASTSSSTSKASSTTSTSSASTSTSKASSTSSTSSASTSKASSTTSTSSASTSTSKASSTTSTGSASSTSTTSGSTSTTKSGASTSSTSKASSSTSTVTGTSTSSSKTGSTTSTSSGATTTTTGKSSSTTITGSVTSTTSKGRDPATTTSTITVSTTSANGGEPWGQWPSTTPAATTSKTVSNGGAFYGGSSSWGEWTITTGSESTTCSQPQPTTTSSCAVWGTTSSCSNAVATPTPICWVCDEDDEDDTTSPVGSATWGSWAVPSSTPAAATTTSWASWSDNGNGNDNGNNNGGNGNGNGWNNGNNNGGNGNGWTNGNNNGGNGNGYNNGGQGGLPTLVVTVSPSAGQTWSSWSAEPTSTGPAQTWSTWNGNGNNNGNGAASASTWASWNSQSTPVQASSASTWASWNSQSTPVQATSASTWATWTGAGAASTPAAASTASSWASWASGASATGPKSAVATYAGGAGKTSAGVVGAMVGAVAVGAMLL